MEEEYVSYTRHEQRMKVNYLSQMSKALGKCLGHADSYSNVACITSKAISWSVPRLLLTKDLP